MSEDQLINRMARAMADADNEGGDFGMTGADVMDCERGREAYVKRARAALATIREAGCEVVPKLPTQAMVNAGLIARMNIEGGYVGGPGSWEAMLSASPLKGDA